MTKGRKPSSEFSKNKSFVCPLPVWLEIMYLVALWGVSISVVIRRAVAVLRANPGLWDAFAELAEPEQLRRIERGEE